MEVLQAVFAPLEEPLQRLWERYDAAPYLAKVSLGAVGFVLMVYVIFCLWFYGTTRRVRNRVSLKGKTVIITGANAGIGRETAVDLASRGARVIMACRNPTKAQAAVVEVRRRSGNDDVVFRQLDTSDLQSVRAFAEKILKEEDRLDILINNAGIGRAPFQVTPEGFEIVMATNHVGHFLLTMLLVDLLKRSAPSRVVSVSSLLHQEIKTIDYTNKAAKGIRGLLIFYIRSKLANIHFTKELGRRLSGTGVTAYVVHPGFIHSNIWDTSFSSIRKKVIHYIMLPILWFGSLSEKDGAQTTIYCATEESITNLSGGYFANCRLAKPSKLARDEGPAKQLWAVSCEATGIDPNKL